MYTNQAGTAFLEGWAVDVSVDRRFNLEELTTFSFAATTSLNFGTVGILVGQYGFDAYSEQKIGKPTGIDIKEQKRFELCSITHLLSSYKRTV